MANTWPNEGKYVGEFKNGKRHGDGIYTHAYGGETLGAVSYTHLRAHET